MVSENNYEMLGTSVKKKFKIPERLGRKCEFRNKKLLWEDQHYETEEKWTHSNEMPTRCELKHLVLRF